jgi:hypothetical protein
MIPEFDENGNLPPGIHNTNLSEVEKRFGGSQSRKRSLLIKSLKQFVNAVKRYADEIYIDGSFITSKTSPGDVDILVIFPAKLISDQQFLININILRNRLKSDLHVFTFFLGFNEAEMDKMMEWFTHDRDGNPKGIIRLV